MTPPASPDGAMFFLVDSRFWTPTSPLAAGERWVSDASLRGGGGRRRRAAPGEEHVGE
jgi:hypothetical protein